MSQIRTRALKEPEGFAEHFRDHLRKKRLHDSLEDQANYTNRNKNKAKKRRQLR